MFCPLGYEPISRLVDRVPKYVFDRFYNSHIEKFSNESRYALSVSVSDFIEVAMWVIVNEQLHICSPKGDLLKVDFRLFRSDHFTVQDLENLENNKKIDISPSIEKSLCLNYLIDAVDFENESKKRSIGYWELSKELGYQYNYFSVPLFYERQCYTISLIGYREFSKVDYIELDWIRPAIAVAAEFEGWSLCVPEDFAKDGWDAAWSENERKIYNSPEDGLLGRPPVLRTEAIFAYKNLYPNGHGSKSWPLVAREINKQTNRSMSVDTVKRAVKELNQGKIIKQK